MAPIPVLYIADAVHDGAAGGTERQLSYLLGHLDRRRISPRLAVFRSTDYVRATQRHLCPTQVLGIRRLRDPMTAFRLARLALGMRRRAVRVAHVYFNDASLVAPPFCRLAGARVVVSRRDMGFWYTPQILRVLRLTNRFVTGMIVNSEAVGANVSRQERYSPARTHVLRNGIDVSAVGRRPAFQGLRERCGIGPDDPVIGMVAHFHPWKRQRDLVQAFREVLRTHPSAHLLFVGSGKCEAEVRALCDGALEQRVHFLGAVPDAVPLVRHFTVGVLCSDSEGLSNAVLEYQACGVPVVCTNVGGNGELVQDGRNGFLTAPGDVPALADRLGRLLDDPGLRCAMGARGRAVAEAHSLAAMAEAHMALYESLDSGGTRPC
jgi:glycosyltransferase involved in cell wall biosynthesis